MVDSTRWDNVMGKVASLLQNEEGADEEAAAAPFDRGGGSGGGGSSLLERARDSLGLRPSAREEMIETYCPALTLKQRLAGFGVCFAVGTAVTLSALFSFSFAHMSVDSSMCVDLPAHTRSCMCTRRSSPSRSRGW